MNKFITKKSAEYLNINALLHVSATVHNNVQEVSVLKDI